MLKLDAAISAQVRDWIDADSVPNPGGAEDTTLQLRRPPYRAANRPFVHVSELRLLPAVEASSYDVLLPHVCALPAATPMNLNTISVELWMSLDEIGLRPAQRLARDGRARYTDMEQVSLEFEALGLPPLAPEPMLALSSQYFVVEAEIVADGIPFLYSSLLQRRPEGIRVVARNRGRY